MRWPKSSSSLMLLLRSACLSWLGEFSAPSFQKSLTNVISSVPLPTLQKAFCLQSLPCALREERRQQQVVSTAAAFPPGKILPREEELLPTSVVFVSSSELWLGVQHGYNVMTTALSEVRIPYKDIQKPTLQVEAFGMGHFWSSGSGFHGLIKLEDVKNTPLPPAPAKPTF